VAKAGEVLGYIAIALMVLYAILFAFGTLSVDSNNN
jgi:hypothetical protein